MVCYCCPENSCISHNDAVDISIRSRVICCYLGYWHVNYYEDAAYKPFFNKFSISSSLKYIKRNNQILYHFKSEIKYRITRKQQWKTVFDHDFYLSPSICCGLRKGSDVVKDVGFLRHPGMYVFSKISTAKDIVQWKDEFDVLFWWDTATTINKKLEKNNIFNTSLLNGVTEMGGIEPCNPAGKIYYRDSDFMRYLSQERDNWPVEIELEDDNKPIPLVPEPPIAGRWELMDL